MKPQIAFSVSAERKSTMIHANLCYRRIGNAVQDPSFYSQSDARGVVWLWPNSLCFEARSAIPSDRFSGLYPAAEAQQQWWQCLRTTKLYHSYVRSSAPKVLDAYPAQQVKLMEQNPKELPKAHSHAHAKAMILWKPATVKRK